MSIVIKDKEMPKSCYDCFIKFGLCSYYDPYSFDEKHNVIRPRKCLLIELKPHGDLIDRKCLNDIAVRLMDIAKNDEIANGVEWLWQYLLEAPTIIESEDDDG